MGNIRNSQCTFFTGTLFSPKLRIVVAGVLLALWPGMTGCDKLGLGDGGGSPTAPSGPPAAGSTIRYAAVGASDVAGIGSSAPCLLTDCPDGRGYVAVAARDLRALGFTVPVNNLGIPTAVVSRRFQDLGNQYGHTVLGNFIDQEVPFIPGGATLVTIFAGGNDLNVITAALGGGAGGTNPEAYIDQQVRAFGEDYATLLSGVRARAGSARIIVLNLPNLAALPFLAGASLAQRQAAQRIAVGMTTTVINRLVSQSVIVIDLMCDARMYQPATYSSDGFHPSDAGHAIMAGEVVRAATSSAYPQPQSSCGPMTTVP